LESEEMRRALLYLFIYVFVLMFFAKPIDTMMGVDAWYAIMLMVLWVVISAAIVHIIHFWPTKIR
jgi:hypothetical protein